MKRKAPQRDFSFIARQRGMFSFTGLTKEQVRRLLWLLLAGHEDAIIGAFKDAAADSSQPTRAVAGESYPLFEQMVGALVSDRVKLGEIGRLVENLEQTEEGRLLLPEGVLALWTSLKAVMEQTDGTAGPA